MNVCGNGVGQETLLNGWNCDAKPETTGAMADIKENPSFACFPHIGLNFFLRIELWCQASIEVSMDVARPHMLENELFVTASGFGMKVHHNDGVAQFRCLHCPVHCFPCGRLEVGCLDADDGLRILLHDPCCCLAVLFLDIVLRLVSIPPGASALK